MPRFHPVKFFSWTSYNVYQVHKVMVKKKQLGKQDHRLPKTPVHGKTVTKGSSMAGADPGFFKKGGGIHLRSTSKKRGGAATLGPMLKNLYRGPKMGGPEPPSGSAHV